MVLQKIAQKPYAEMMQPRDRDLSQPNQSTVTPPLQDLLGRPIHDLRLSVTDRCNLRCTYCMPAEVFGPDYQFLPKSELLSFEELTRLATIFVRLGVQKLRLTGGEPTLRQDLPQLVARLAQITGLKDLAMTTNGLLLPRLADPLKAAGLQRVTVSLDSLDPPTFGNINGLGITPQKVVAGIEAALAAGLAVKINTVVERGVNDGQLRDFWLAVRELAPVRFIEFMDVGNHNGWNHSKVVPSSEVLARLATATDKAEARAEFSAQSAHYSGEVAKRYRHHSGHEVGLISSVTAPFCGDCSRSRLSAVGQLYTCLFATQGHDLRQPLREGANDIELAALIRQIWQQRQDRYSEQRGQATAKAQAERPKVEMSHIGG